MKKRFKTAVTLILTLIFCFPFVFVAGCGETTLESLKNEYGIFVEGGGFKEGTTLVTKELDLTSDEAQTAIESVKNLNDAIKGNLYVFDISTLLDGVKIQPDGKVKVTMPAPSEGAIAYDVFHIKDSGACEKLVATYLDGKVSFETDSFSLFVLVEGKNEYKLAVNSGHAGSVEVNGENLMDLSYVGTIARGETVTLKAIENEGYGFDGWYDIYGSVVSYSSRYTFTMDSDMYITAKYVGLVNVMFKAKDKEVLAIEGNFEYNGEIHSHVQGMWEIGKEYTVKAIPNFGYMFLYWEIEGKEVYGDVYHGVVDGFPGDEFLALAVFEKTDYCLQVKAIGGGKITENGEDVSTLYQKGFEDARSVTLTAIADEGYHFVGWFDEEGTCLSTSDSYEINVDGKKKLEARFESDEALVEEVTLTATAGEGGIVTEDYVNGKKVEKGSSVTVSATPNNDYRFVGWYVGETKVSDETRYTFTINEDTTLVAKFEKDTSTECTVTATAGEGGIVTEDYVNGKKVEKGSSVTVSATPNNDYRFVGWYVGETKVSDEIRYTFTVNESVTLVAKFEKNTKPVTTYRFLCNIQGNGSIWENDENATETYQYGATLNAGTKITLTAKPDTYWQFKGWYESDGTSLISTDATYTFELTETIVVCAIFEEKPMISFFAYCEQPDGGYITENGQLVEFDGERMVDPGTQITLTAVANDDYSFKGWYYYDQNQVETLISDKATHTFTVNEPLSVYAKFEEKTTYIFLAQCDPYDGGYITENGERVDFGNGRMVDPDTQITLTAVANDGYAFKGWGTRDDEWNLTIISTDATYTFTISESVVNEYGSYYVQAVFEEKPNGLKIDAHNAGFTYNENGELVTTVYVIGNEIKPNIEYVGVYATYKSSDKQDEYLTLGEDYTRDLGGLDFTKVGTYTVTYTYIADPSITISLTVQVVAE